MKKTLIAAAVGALIIFLWQFISYGPGKLHKAATGYTEKQETIRQFLVNQQLPEGGYFIPNLPPTATMDDWSALGDREDGKPWVSIQYHNRFSKDMTGKMIRGYGVNLIIVLLFCFLLSKFSTRSMATTVTAALAVGLIVFLNAPYTGAIWYDTFDIWAQLLDAVVSWGLTGLWLGWYLNRGKNDTAHLHEKEKSYQMA